MKQVKALILAILMIFALSVPTFAVTPDLVEPNGGIGPVYPGYSRITGDGVYLRTSPSTSATAIGQLFRGDKCEKIRREGDWYYVKMISGQNSGRMGYVYCTYVGYGY